VISREGQDIIRELLDLLRRIKGPAGRIRLQVSFDGAEGHEAGTRGVITPKPVPVDTPQGNPEASTGFQTVGSLPVGARIRFSGWVPTPGHLHLFNLGTSGTGEKLFPKERRANAVSPSDVFELPSARLFPGHKSFAVTKPTTAESGEPERLLVILTLDDIDLQCGDLHPRLVNRDALGSLCRGPGFSGPCGATTSRLLQLDPARWEYGLVEIDVI
jgi:hypothetical protein